ncbi:hypothetical protein TB2_007681 [Malus domestica]
MQMARSYKPFFLILLFGFAFCMPTFGAGRLLRVENNGKGGGLSSEDSLMAGTETDPDYRSLPSLGEHEGHHAVPSNVSVGKQFITTLHDQLRSVKAQSVPSPGAGHINL